MNKNKTVFPIFLAFLCMGFGDLGAPLKGLFVDTFGLSNTVATLSTTMLSFGMFGLLSIPMGVLQYKKGRVFVLTMGLFTAVAGMIFPLFSLSLATAILSLLLMGAGATMLQVAGNPVMRDVSNVGKFSRNLSIAQAFKSIGTLSTALIPLLAGLWITAETGWLNRDNSWRILFPLFGAVLLITGIWFLTVKVDEKKVDQAPTTFRTSFAALKDPYIGVMTFMIFIYVGVEVCLFANASTYLKDIFGFSNSLLATVVAIASLTVGRLVGGAILDRGDPKKLFIFSTLLALVGFVCFLFPVNLAMAWTALVLSGLGLANLFPLIFSITMDDRPSKENEISGLMTTAIIGGAFVPLVHSGIADAVNASGLKLNLFGLAGDKVGVLLGFLWPILLLGVILTVAIVVYGKSKKKAETGL